MKHLTKKEKALIEKYVTYLVKRYSLSESCNNQQHHFEIHDDCIGMSKSDIKNFHIGMEWFAEQIIHTLKTPRPAKSKFRNYRILNQI